MTNEELVIRIRAGVDVADNMLQLWQQNQGLIGKIAGRYRGLADEDDLKQEGYFGLCEAVEHWDADRGVLFSGILFQYVRNAMLRYCQNNGTIRIPVGAGERILKYQRLREAFRLQVGREPTDREICYYLGVSEEILARIRKDAEMAKIGSLDKPLTGEDQETTVGDIFPSSGEMENDILDEVQLRQLQAVLWPMVDSLPGKIPGVLRARYQEQRTLKQIGEEYGCSMDNIRQIEQKGIRELRKSHRERMLRPFLQDYIDTHAYKGNGVGSFNRTWTSSTEKTALKLVEGGCRFG